MNLLEGRGLWCGASGTGSNGRRIYTEATWDAFCRQAKAWGITVVHPKVADGGYLWYSTDALMMLKRVADHYSLQVAPYHYCYAYGALIHEAEIDAALGGIFSMVCPDMEVEWQTAEASMWANTYGRTVRQHYSGPIYPTVFANPNDHPFPYQEMNKWVNGFMPQVYFAEWDGQSADHAIGYIYPQWEQLDQALLHSTGKHLQPLLPIIELGHGLPAHEVVTWLQKMGGYGYCGFWYDSDYAPYAGAIASAPMPHRKLLSAPQPKVQQPNAQPVVAVAAPKLSPAFPAIQQPVSSPALSLPTLSVPQGTSMVPVRQPVATSPTSANSDLPAIVTLPATPGETSSTTTTGQTLTSVEQQLKIIWQSRVPDLIWDPTLPLIADWMQRMKDGDTIGVPLHDEKRVTREGLDIGYIAFDSGHRLLCFYINGQATIWRV